MLIARARAASAAATMVHPATQQISGLARWWARTRDMPEVLLLYGWLGFALSIAGYTTKRVYFNDQAGSYVNVNLRGDPMRQVETARVGMEDPAKQKHSVWYYAAQFKVDEKGPNPGIFDNRVRPGQYAKPGEAGIGAAGLPH
ncbi:hypothetical protein Rsub_11132 [Raphidocelis subcapitata]|uniref:Uncharacterized protein n=1 Tax=Raphidocelis subcapitata TaxID=307507 RepID=A0A2V0PDU2_9CHLO|nr:hypothetical protein Rsub_11132 [Raphidocelis subcapitata]|eukprot:GBF98021.1 hypothetical protein Rsub_11132 [Raphidocelis subcapitata]